MSEGFKATVFKHHRPITGDDIETRLLTGLDGAFGEVLRDINVNVDEPTVGVVVQFNSAGEIKASRIAKCSLVKPKELNTRDVWPEAQEGRLVIQEFDLSVFGDFNGCLTTRYGELPFKILIKKGESWKGVKKGEYELHGLGSLVFPTNFIPLSQDRSKFLISAIPGDLKTLQATYGGDVGSRSFLGIRVYKGRAKMVTSEEEEHRWGLGLQPFYIVSDAAQDAQGKVDTTNVSFLGSMAIKLAVAGLL
jgi:hypothetical protein